MNDTNILQLNIRQTEILEKIQPKKLVSSSEVFKLLDSGVSLVTVKRDLEYLVGLKYLERKGKGRSTSYEKTTLGVLFSPIDPSKYNKTEPDMRSGRGDFNFSLFDEFPKNLFSVKEKEMLDVTTGRYREKIKSVSPVGQMKELERFVIELSWKSSKIEGNTYTLLDTERLLREGIPAEGHTPDETAMIINHKKAFSFILENIKEMRTNGITVPFIEKVHELLVADLKVKRGLRSGLVGIIGTKYKPLDNKYQIKEALEGLCTAVNRMEGVFTKAFAVLVGISYIQPFEDGNKRAARLLCNAVLLSSNYAPLSYRSVDEINYRESILVFYEMNSLVPMKKIFIEQYLFSAQNYLVNAP
ncbi:hypothetical protein A3A03_02825 [Candidatus Nomurabacteria bacterium RIFCSPLOWO2_01_FULL_40_18]|uniref:Fido domain-containing protein n=1 Tax=Candidatus Nomurabacteria bacterium RIFCSPLOWO2_01_FULL_40_18 TaxID=1801773 RepID=A0A1F6XK08_9BACT|nr:MAG: hypothetical protein A3A03_02825 [Candidatus Nomurabacteria bacterium RIFCSPLOWO2_01_FULL_40_18]